MIVGVGTDLVEIARIKKIIEGAAGDRFLRRILTEREALLPATGSGRRVEFAAGRFAAKEAVAKAIGCGIGGEVGFHDIEILPDDRGKPLCTLSPQALAILPFAAPPAVHISISHSEVQALAFAVVELQD